MLMPRQTFIGSNEDTEIETAKEFENRVRDAEKKALEESAGSDEVIQIGIHGWNFQNVDFTQIEMSVERWNRFDFSGSHFWGCTFPSFVDIEELRNCGASVAEQPEDLPFKPFRGFMYTCEELAMHDQKIYHHFLQSGDLRSLLFRTLHDYFIQDALFDYLEGKTVIAVMGGHGLKRQDKMYQDVVLVSWKLASQGFVIASGGGPGAMEAANLGAYLAGQDQKSVEEALQIISTVGYEDGKSYLHDFENKEAPKAVLERFGPSSMSVHPSLGIPTWKYGHEPANMFATWQAKMFSNAVREDGLIAIANGGIIFSPGSAGTRQEIFQAACRNHYAKKGEAVPMVFFGTEFWEKSNLISALKHNSESAHFLDWIHVSDNVDEICRHLVRFRSENALPVVSLEKLKKDHSVLFGENIEIKESKAALHRRRKGSIESHRERRKHLKDIVGAFNLSRANVSYEGTK